MINIKESGMVLVPRLPEPKPQIGRVFSSKPITLRVHRMDNERLASIRQWLKAQAIAGRAAIKAGNDPVKVVEYLRKNHP